MIYIIGKDGYIGKSLCEHFGERATGIGRDDEWPLEFKREDCIVNCACSGWNDARGSIEAVESNINLPLRLNRARGNAVMIQLGTGIEFCVNESDSLYAASKRVSSICLSGKAHVVYLYTIWGGKHEPRSKFMRRLFDSALVGEEFHIENPYISREFTHIRHLFGLVDTLSTDRTPKTIHFATGRDRRLFEAASAVAGISGWRGVRCNYHELNPNRRYRCAGKPSLPDTFLEDVKFEWEAACRS